MGKKLWQVQAEKLQAEQTPQHKGRKGVTKRFYLHTDLATKRDLLRRRCFYSSGPGWGNGALGRPASPLAARGGSKGRPRGCQRPSGQAALHHGNHGPREASSLYMALFVDHAGKAVVIAGAHRQHWDRFLEIDPEGRLTIYLSIGFLLLC